MGKTAVTGRKKANLLRAANKPKLKTGRKKNEKEKNLKRNEPNGAASKQQMAVEKVAQVPGQCCCPCPQPQRCMQVTCVCLCVSFSGCVSVSRPRD